MLEKYWTQFLDRHEKVYEFRKEFEAHEYFSKEAYNLAETAYIDAIAELNSDINEQRTADLDVTVPSTPPQGVVINSPATPKVALPTFSGKQEKWEPNCSICWMQFKVLLQLASATLK